MINLTTPTAINDLPLTMSSLEIAERTGKRHADVMRDVRNMLEGLGEDERSFASVYRAGNGVDRPCFELPKRECLILVTSYSVQFRAAVIDRWQELERESADPSAHALRALNEPAAMRGLLLGYTERVIALESRVAEMTPQVEALDRIADTYGTFCRSTAAKMLNVPPQTLTRWMRTNGWTFKRPGGKDDIAYQAKVNDGLLEHKITTGLRPDGTEWSSTQVRVTAKGVTALAKAFPPAACAA